MRFLSFFLLLTIISCETAEPEVNLSYPEVDSSIKKETIDSNTLELFTSIEGEFSIHMPSKPIKDIHTTSSEIGEIKLTQYIHSKNNTQAWLVSHSDYPPKMIQIGNNTKLLSGIKYRVLKSLGAKTIFEHNIKLKEKYNGLAFVAHTDKKNMDIMYQIYLVNNRVYQLSMYSSIGPITKKDSLDFFGSFKLLAKKQDL